MDANLLTGTFPNEIYLDKPVPTCSLRSLHIVLCTSQSTFMSPTMKQDFSFHKYFQSISKKLINI